MDKQVWAALKTFSLNTFSSENCHKTKLFIRVQPKKDTLTAENVAFCPVHRK